MKQKLALVLFMASLAVVPLIAGDAAPKSTRVQQKLREIDLNIMLKQYEYVATQLAEIRLQGRLIAIDKHFTDTERKAKLQELQDREEILHEFSDEYRARAASLDESEKSSAEATAK